jgi:hypothetical protein
LWCFRHDGGGCGWLGGGCCLDFFLGGEVGGGDLEAVEEAAGSLEVHLVGGDADEDVGDGALDGVAGFGAVEGEGVVGEDVGHVGDDVVETGVLVVHGVGAAADAVGVGPDALVRLGWLVLELWEDGKGHRAPPGVYT